MARYSLLLLLCASVFDRAVVATYQRNGHRPRAIFNDDVNTIMPGDLQTVGPQTATGRSIFNILMRTESGQSEVKGYVPPGKLGSSACGQDICCPLSYASKFLVDKMTTKNGECNDLARAAIRLGFHDAGTWSRQAAAQGNDFGGADGSIILAADEIARPENNGLQDIVSQMQGWRHKFGISAADLVQFAATVAVVACPLGPRMRFFAGRVDSSRPALNGLLPSAKGNPDELIALFEDKTISAHELSALLGAHTCSKQFSFNTSTTGLPQDSTPGIWDTLYYNETQDPSARPIQRFPSDIALARDSRLSGEWAKFRLPGGVGQDHWNEDYAAAAIRLSLLGVNNINSLKECTIVLPDS